MNSINLYRKFVSRTAVLNVVVGASGRYRMVARKLTGGR
jgi:hypothetical protein